MLDPPDLEVSATADIEPAELDQGVPGWLIWVLAALTGALGLLLYLSYGKKPGVAAGLPPRSVQLFGKVFFIAHHVDKQLCSVGK